MLKAWAFVLVAASVLSSGCFEWGGVGIKRNEADTTSAPIITTPAPTSQALCPNAALKQQAGDALQTFFSTMNGKTVSMRMKGKMDGTATDVLISMDPANSAVLVQANGETLKAVGDFYSLAGTVSGYGRDYGPESIYRYATFVKSFSPSGNTGPGVNFLADVATGLGSVHAECSLLNGVEVIRFLEGSNVIVAERAPPYRPLQLTVKQDADNDWVADFSHDKPNIQVDGNLPRVPANLAFQLTSSSMNARGGEVAEATTTLGTAWVPLQDVRFEILDPSGFVIGSDTLDSAQWDYTGDIFSFFDADGNGMLSEGDMFSYDLAQGYSLLFQDDWAGSPLSVS